MLTYASKYENIIKMNK